MSNHRFARLYAAFDAPVAAFDCGEKCAPYNAGGRPFCCDPRHAVPALYHGEWAYLQEAAPGFWRLWEGKTPEETQALRDETPPGQVLAVCAGPEFCATHRAYRSLTCRAFPFFPYLDRQGNFLGLSYYWHYEDRCWLLSHLDVVTETYRDQFVRAFEQLFRWYPQERENFRYHSLIMRRVFGRRHREIPLFHRTQGWVLVRPRDGRLRPVDPRQLPKHGVYAIAADLPFPDEMP